MGRNKGAIVCEHVAVQGKPILLAQKDEVVADDDSGWQFLCGASDESQAGAQVWSLQEVVDYDNSIQGLVTSAEDGCYVRRDIMAPWKRQD